MMVFEVLTTSSCCCCRCGGGGGSGACSVQTALTFCLEDYPKEEISCDCAVIAC